MNLPQLNSKYQLLQAFSPILWLQAQQNREVRVVEVIGEVRVVEVVGHTA